MNHGYTYQAALAAAQKVNWRVEDVIGGDKRLDFDKPFLPESLARVEPLAFLSREERRLFNQIRGHNYLYMFGAVEEFILPFVLDHVRPQLTGEDYRTRALLQFAGEEAKHIHLFKRFRDEFEAGFGTPCEVIGPAHEIARAVLSHHPIGVVLAILHIEWMTQRHYVESVKDDGDLDRQFESLLRHHWMEEAQHAKLDTLMLEAMADLGSRRDVEEGIREYGEIGAFLDGGLGQQVELDLDSFERASGRKLSVAERRHCAEVQRQAMRWTFLGSGMTHPNFLASVEDLSPAARAHIEQSAAALC
jgi:hypothetical protein